MAKGPASSTDKTFKKKKDEGFSFSIIVESFYRAVPCGELARNTCGVNGRSVTCQQLDCGGTKCNLQVRHSESKPVLQ